MSRNPYAATPSAPDPYLSSNNSYNAPRAISNTRPAERDYDSYGSRSGTPPASVPRGDRRPQRPGGYGGFYENGSGNGSADAPQEVRQEQRGPERRQTSDDNNGYGGFGGDAASERRPNGNTGLNSGKRVPPRSPGRRVARERDGRPDREKSVESSLGSRNGERQVNGNGYGDTREPEVAVIPRGNDDISAGVDGRSVVSGTQQMSGKSTSIRSGMI